MDILYDVGARGAADRALPHIFVKTLFFVLLSISWVTNAFTRTYYILFSPWKAYFNLESLSPRKSMATYSTMSMAAVPSSYRFCFRLSPLLDWIGHCRWNSWSKFWMPALNLMKLKPNLLPFLSWPSYEVPVSSQQKSHCQCTCYFVIWGISLLCHIVT